MPRTTVLVACLLATASTAVVGQAAPDFNDSHFHITNYVQEGITAERFLEIMGNRVGRSTLFGIPLQQTWSYSNSRDYAPTYYLQTDAPLYYYSFTDAHIASIYQKLSPAAQRRFDPMITGFNPADMYAVAHIRRVLKTFPGVFTGIGEFTIHKEFVSPKVAGEVATLMNPALDSVLDFAAESGLVVILHSDMDMPFGKAGQDPVYLNQMKALFRRHPRTTIIWAHIGLGRVVRPVTGGSAPDGEQRPNHIAIAAEILADPAFSNVYFDISWDEVAKYIVRTPETVTAAAQLINRFPDRFLFGSDVVAPSSPEQYFAVFDMYAPLWKSLTPETSAKVRLENYERLFGKARCRVREWEKVNVNREVKSCAP